MYNKSIVLNEEARQSRNFHFLVKMQAFIPYEKLNDLFFKHQVISSFHGVPSSTYIEILCLQDWYRLSDNMTEELLYDRTSFREFIHYDTLAYIPSAEDIHEFKQMLKKHSILGHTLIIIQQCSRINSLCMKKGIIRDAMLR